MKRNDRTERQTLDDHRHRHRTRHPQNLAKLDLIQDTGVSLERDTDDSGDNTDNGLID